MQSKFFKPFQVSPVFTGQILFGVSLMYDAARDPQGKHNASRFILATVSICLSAMVMPGNYREYQMMLKILEKQGYQKKWADPFMESRSARRALKVACEEKGYGLHYQVHTLMANMGWQKKMGEAALDAGLTVGMGAIAAVSHHEASKQKFIEVEKGNQKGSGYSPRK